MRLTSITLGLLLAVTTATMAAEQEPSTIKKEHPGDAALSQDEDGSFHYKSFPGLQTLFVYDGDSPGKSNCNTGCLSAWLPLLVSGGEKVEKVGDWVAIRREDGRMQWAYKGQPVYMRYHNMPPDEGSEKEGFHLLKP
ncbi:MAG TPA: hypothetical protein VNQ81_15540 [Povalibacter sp.]|nr:hypothetical protein [Povalibacter sp.]